MSKETIYRCDRCRCELAAEPKQDTFDFFLVQGTTSSNVAVDLCAVCKTSLKSWWDNAQGLEVKDDTR